MVSRMGFPVGVQRDLGFGVWVVSLGFWFLRAWGVFAGVHGMRVSSLGFRV